MEARLVKVRGWAWKLAVPAVGLAVAAQLALAGTASATRTVAAVHHTAHLTASVHNLLDCNVTALKRLCTDPHGFYDKKASRFIDPKTHTYIGHDEPSVKFISTATGSGNTMTYGMQLSKDPKKAPTATGSVTKYGELSVAPWFGLPMCDPNSYPQKGCTPLSDGNSGAIDNPNAAGSAFMELQFYPPGFTPFVDSTSCSATQWCAALTIDSLECSFQFATCNTGCIEPVNFAFLQTNGVPAGNPAPQDPTLSTFMGNSNTLKMNPGDVLKVAISDVSSPSSGTDTGGLRADVWDLTSNTHGWMVASAANGFQNTDPSTCGGSAFSFHAEYDTASQQNQVPWAALEGGVLMQQEIGHGEACKSVASKLGFSATFGDGSSYHDPSVFQTCKGGTDSKTGEGPCSLRTANCQHATTQGKKGPVACPQKSFASGALCEFADAYCFPKGNRTVTINGVRARENAPVAICYQNAFQNGDLDFDGLDYRADWPNGSANFPTPMRYVGPFTNGSTYPNIQFETDAAGSEALCNVATGAKCTAPPLGAKFYPFWTLNKSQAVGSLASAGSCVWNFGNDIAKVTASDFGKAKQYGTPDVARYGGTLTSAVLANPALASGCATIPPF